ncbi:hypothetical protein [Nocardia sp. NPDC051750]|uniref:hypothetical protein n=1 Tax=Nocardia sp. NPDC051750 TaxID=3364325 RepID=UPI0037964BDC
MGPEFTLALSESEARELTARIRTGLETTWELIQEAWYRRVWEPLGYGSWDSYCQAELDTVRLRIPREERQGVVASLRESGMSTRAIGSAIGVDQKTVSNDLRGREENSSGEVRGLDGKSYAPPNARIRPHRRPIVNQALEAVRQINKGTEMVRRILADDRYPKNRTAVNDELRNAFNLVAEMQRRMESEGVES